MRHSVSLRRMRKARRWTSRRSTCSRTYRTVSAPPTTRSNITLEVMDKQGIAVGLVGLGNEATVAAIERHPDRFKASLEVDPNNIGAAVRSIRRAHEEYGIKAVTTFPAGCNPQVPASDRHYYPIYQTCVELDIPLVANAGIAGPRVPSECQNVMHFDQVCYDFPTCDS